VCITSDAYLEDEFRRYQKSEKYLWNEEKKGYPHYLKEYKTVRPKGN
jgi:hypothetical protein